MKNTFQLTPHPQLSFAPEQALANPQNKDPSQEPKK